MDKKEDAPSGETPASTNDSNAPATTLANPGFLQSVQQRIDSLGDEVGGFLGEGYAIIIEGFSSFIHEVILSLSRYPSKTVDSSSSSSFSLFADTKMSYEYKPNSSLLARQYINELFSFHSFL